MNLPNWLALQFRIADGQWFDERHITIFAYRQELDLRRGMLLRTMKFEDGKGRRSTLKERRLVSMADMHLAALEVSLTAENWSGTVTIRSGDRWPSRELGREALSQIQQQASGAARQRKSWARMACRCSCAPVSRISTWRRQLERKRSVDGELHDVPRRVVEEPGYIAQEWTVELTQGHTLILEKIASFYTSRDHAISECSLEARKAVTRAGRFEAVMARACPSLETHLAPIRD